MTKQKAGTKTIHRSSKTGEFVKKEEVKRNPRETETEHRPRKKSK